MDNARITDIYKFLPVDERLCTSGQPTQPQLVALAHAGFEVVVNLGLHDDPRYSLADEPGLVHSLGMLYVHIPVAFDAPTETDLRAFFDAMEKHRSRKVLVHCAANARVSAFMGLYKVIRQNEATDSAFAAMKSVWEPNSIWTSFISSMLKKYRADGATGALAGR